jgi:hypothetical protein
MKRIPKIKARAVNAADDALGYLGCLAVAGPRVFACGGTYHKPTILVSNDGGGSFTRAATPVTPGLRDIAVVDGTVYVAGEYGTFAASVDGGLTWTPIPTPTDTCLFRIHRARDGWWIIGDGGVVLRSADGFDFAHVDCDWDSRLLAIAEVAGVVHILGYDGTIRRWTGSALEALELDAGQPLTDLCVTKLGTWLVTGDGGTLLRSTDRGKTFAPINAPEAELEAILETPRGVFVVGSDGMVLFSDDDGKSFVKVPLELDGHLWSLAIAPSGELLIGGDEGAIWSLAIAADATMQVDDAPFEKENENENDEDEEDDDDDDDSPAPVATFASVEEASARWIKEGTTFANELNGYVRRCYTVGPNKAGKEPDETRQDMADYVRRQLIELNARGDHPRARTLFPPAYEPFDYDALGQGIDQLMYLADGRLLVRVGGETYFVERDRIAPVEGVSLFARSFDRRYVAKGYADRVDVHAGWDGPRTASFPRTFDDAASAQLTPDGSALLIANDTGIHWVTDQGATRLLPDEEEESVSYPHAALSPNGRFVAMGTQDSGHILIDRKTGRRRIFEPVSSYPHLAAFHADRPEVVFNSCHALYGSGTLAVSLDAVLAEQPRSARVLDKRHWAYGFASTPNGYLLADRSGYVWALDFEGEQQWYLFVGSTLTAIDVSPDRKKLVLGSFAGYVIELDLTAASSDPMLLTDGPVRELARWVFWVGHPPLIW